MTIAKAEQASMIRAWYREVIKHSAFTFVSRSAFRDVSNGDPFLTVHMKSPAVYGDLTANSQQPGAAA
jgi:hypothetical protein